MISSTETVVDAPNLAAALAGKADSAVPSTDFGIIPIPKRLRYDPDKPFHFGLLLNVSFGFASTFGTCLKELDRCCLNSVKSLRIYTIVNRC